MAAKNITNADGGTLYRVTDERTLEFAILRNDTLGVAMGGTTGAPVPFYPIALYDHDGAPVTSMVAAYAVHHGQSVNIADAYSQEGFDFSGTKSFDQKTGYRSRSFLTMPMKDHENAIIGVLQLLNAKDRATGTVRAFSDADLHLAGVARLAGGDRAHQPAADQPPRGAVRILHPASSTRRSTTSRRTRAAIASACRC